MDIINCKNITYLYSRYVDEEKIHVEFEALKNVSLNIEKGSFVAILGQNGSGKSTLAKNMNALVVPKEGDVYVYEYNTKNTEFMFDIRKRVGMVFQNPDNQIVAGIVEEDIAFGPENLGIPPDEIRKRVDDALKIVRMTDYYDASPHMLSGGQKQRVAIAGIIAMKPDCIVLDEPTAMLDPLGRKEVINTVKLLNKEFGITIVLITHFMEEAVQADRIVVMEDGQIVMEGTPKEVFSRVDEMKNTGLDVPQVTELAHNLKKRGVEGLSDGILTIEEMVNELLRLKK
ncbi:MAG: energy-coupling factor transporter ATPase [Defluviitaleaceae bacterium]|nr:energy-coupling factor transporter ATPase [Defluviitaleaceae bacterium]